LTFVFISIIQIATNRRHRGRWLSRPCSFCGLGNFLSSFYYVSSSTPIDVSKCSIQTTIQCPEGTDGWDISARHTPLGGVLLPALQIRPRSILTRKQTQNPSLHLPPLRRRSSQLCWYAICTIGDQDSSGVCHQALQTIKII